MDFLNLNETVQSAVRIAKGIARDHGNDRYGSAHLLSAILYKEAGLHGFIQSLEKDLGYLREWAQIRIEDYPKVSPKEEIAPDAKIAGIFEEADNIRIKWGLLEINPVCVLAAFTRPGVAFDATQLKSFPIREGEISELYTSSRENKSMVYRNADSDAATEDDTTQHIFTAIGKYCTDLTARAAEGRLTRIVAREQQTRMMMEILGRHSKPNVLIVGEAGVGKTALVEGLACDIVERRVPAYMEGTTIFELDNGALIAGATYKGEIEDRLKSLLKEIKSIDRAILFIDDIHVLLDPKSGNAGAGSILQPELSKGNLTVIGVTTIDDYRKIIEPDTAFNRRFEVLQIDEPDDASALRMVEVVLDTYTRYHKIEVSKDAVAEAIRLARRYIKDRRLPDSAIDLLDRTLSAAKMINETARKDLQEFLNEVAQIEQSQDRPEEERAERMRMVNMLMQNRLSPILLGMLTEERDTKEIESYGEWHEYLTAAIGTLQDYVKEPIRIVTPYEVAAVISNKTGIPIGKIQAGEKERLLNMEELLRRRVVGQDDALKSIVDAILESRSGMNKTGQPVGSVFLLGPTGTGKTELAKALAEALFNDEKSMIRIDMSEYKEEHSAALLLGAPPGYVGYEEGGILVNRIRRQPYSVVLFDEIEKAHQSVYDIFLQIMDEGKLHDRLGKEGDFSNAIVLFTSNVGSQWIVKQKEAGRKPTNNELMEVMSDWFRPEFLARLSEIVPFYPITEDILIRIFDIQFRSVTDVLGRKDIVITISDEAKKMLSHRGFTPQYGARQVAGIIRNQLRRPLSRLLIGGSLSKGGKIEIGLGADGELTWKIS